MKFAVKAQDAKAYLVASVLARLHLAIRPQDYDGLCLLARCLYYLKQDQSADQTYRRAIRVNPLLARAHAELGQLHYYNAVRIIQENSLFPGGVDLMFRNEVSADEYDPKLLHPLHSSYADAEVANRNVAIKEFVLAAGLESDNRLVVQRLDMAALLLCEQGKQGEAVKLYERILDIDNSVATAHAHLAGCCAWLGWKGRALAEYEWLRLHAPDLAETILPHLGGIRVD